MSSDIPVKETKAQKQERLKREKNPWEAFEEIRAFARDGRASVVPEWAATYFKWWGSLYPGRRSRRSRRSGRRRQSHRILHDAHRHPQRPHHLPPAPRHRRISPARCAQPCRHHRPPEHPAPWLTIESLPEIVRNAGRIGLSPKGACGDVVRNVTGMPCSPASPTTSW